MEYYEFKDAQWHHQKWSVIDVSWIIDKFWYSALGFYQNCQLLIFGEN